MTFVIADVDTYWVSVFSASGLAEPQVSYAWPEQGVSLSTTCDPGHTNNDSAFYCPSNDTIVVSQDVARRVWLGQYRANDDTEDGKQSGDFSVAYVVAHEYAHSLQAELGILGRTPPLQVSRTELHADCWAGVWAHSAYEEGELDPGDVDEAIKTAKLLGDYAVADPNHHGEPARRIRAFASGYDQGQPDACDSFLLGSG